MDARYPSAGWRKCLCVLSSLLLCATAHAALGGARDSVHSDAEATGASTLQTLVSGTTQFTQRQANGVTIRQYVNASGTVFGVGWDGPVLPDFKRLLGAHFAAYATAQHQPSRRISIQSAALVLDAGGMMRSFSGRAYVPGQLPRALSSLDIH